MEPTMEKKSERLEVRLGYEEKQTFTEACENQGDTPSGAVRRFISGYVRRSDEDVLSSAWRGAAKRQGWKPVAFLVIFVAVTTVFWLLVKQYFTISDDQIFSLRDRNGDGQLEYSEHGLAPSLDGSPNGVLRVLDLDASGTISRNEFRSKGRMVYAVESQPDTVIGSEGETVAMTMVEFDIMAERIKSGTYQGAVINAGELDRLVVWYADGSNSVWEGSVDIDAEAELKIQADRVTFPKSVNIEYGDDESITARRGKEINVSNQ